MTYLISNLDFLPYTTILLNMTVFLYISSNIHRKFNFAENERSDPCVRLKR